MSRPKRWYDPGAGDSLLLVQHSKDDHESYASLRWKHPRTSPGLLECLLYPLSDGPGLGLMVLFPPVLWLLSLPVFDFIAVLEPMTKSDWALGLVVVPVFIPLLFSFGTIVSYLLIFLGRVLVASAMGENDHPHWPELSPEDISEGIARWIWAFLMGTVVGGLPAVVFWNYFGAIDWPTLSVLGLLLFLGVGFTQMALAASLMHETITAANPVTVVAAVRRIGWAYLLPCAATTVAVLLTCLSVYSLLFRMPKMWMEAVALWAFWVFFLYTGMVLLRMLGLTYHAHAMDLYWFRRRPRWATGGRPGRIYANS
ncbi:MAG: hypothetical protein P4L85_06315 [Paludisphaera borealis]|uniref:hypothetical protein n=1 Tax=Paludisphaera borealis TaxID=1387353 RepID=UPI00284377D0|nr:hypothetical protein [Paludisphaera borealis]MDR3618947.1 hypothetical protein [Paludisphaera borealis]